MFSFLLGMLVGIGLTVAGLGVLAALMDAVMGKRYMSNLLKRFWYALRYARIGFMTGWRAHGEIHKLARYYRLKEREG